MSVMAGTDAPRVAVVTARLGMGAGLIGSAMDVADVAVLVDRDGES